MRTELQINDDELAEGQAVAAFLGGLLMSSIPKLRDEGYLKVFVRDGGWDADRQAVLMNLATARGFQLEVAVKLVGVED